MTTREGIVALRSDGVIEAPTWFGPDDRPLFGWFVYPEQARVRGAVVLCAPLAEDGNKSHRTFRECARALAKEGFLAFRFDYDGTGDSAGGLNDPGRRTAWVGSVRSAVEKARHCGVDSVSIVGMRMGATIALNAALDGDLELDRLVLWDPCATGSAYLREQQLLQASWPGARRDVPEGWVETPAYLFSPDTAQDVRSLALSTTLDHDVAHETTVLVRDDRPVPKRIADALPRDRFTWFDVSDQAGLMDVPAMDAAVPTETVRTIVTMFTSSPPSATVDLHIDQQLAAEWTLDGQPIAETAEFLGNEGLLFGIITKPGDEARQDMPARRSALFLNVASERHIGVGRMWTELSRSLVRDNVMSVRMDQSGVGDSGVHPGQRPDAVYDAAWIDDVPDALTSFPDAAGIVGVGVCSSAVSTLQAAADGALPEVVAVNGGLMFKNHVLSRRWTVVVQRKQWLRRLAIKHSRTAALLENAWSTVRPSRHPFHVFGRLIDSGVTVTLLSAPEDAAKLRPTPIWNRLWGRKIDSSPLFRNEVFPEIDHSLRSSTARDVVSQRLAAILTSQPNGA